MAHPKYMTEPIILVNEPYELTFIFPDWANGNEPTRKQYVIGKNKDGTIGHTSYIGEGTSLRKGHIYADRDTVKAMTSCIVYEDEGTFGSAGLLHNGNHHKIKLKGFVKAVEDRNYHKKYTTMMLVGEEPYYKEAESMMKARMEELFGGEIPPNVRVMAV